LTENISTEENSFGVNYKISNTDLISKFMNFLKVLIERFKI
jgi:hypothetical protein